MDLNLKKIKALKVIITTLLVMGFTVSVISCKEPIVEEQPTQGQESEIKNDEVVISSETKPTEEKVIEEETSIDSALEAVLKEKVSFISETLPGAELNTKTGELTAKAGNEWGIKEGESIGCYVVEAFKMETADGVEKQEDAIGLIPTVIETMQNKIYEEKGIKPFPIPINLKEVKNVEITELKINSGDLSGLSTFGIDIPIGTVIYSFLSGEYGYAPLTLSTEIDTKDKSLGGGYFYFKEDKPESSCRYSIDFVEGNIIPELQTKKISAEGMEFEESFYEVKLGDPLIEITGSTFLDLTANKIDDLWYWLFYENPGDYQLNLEHLKNIFKKGIHQGTEIISMETVEFLSLESNQEPENIKIFILPNEPAHEQNS